MKSATSAMISNLANASNLYVADLFTITLADGTILTYTDFDTDIALSGTTYSSQGPYPLLDTISSEIGTQVSMTKLQLWALLTNLVESTAVLQAIVQGKFDNALVLIERVFMPTKGDTSAGAIIVFKGNVSDIPVADRIHAEMDVKSRKELLNIPFPYNVYQPGCRWPLYGAGCTLVKSSFGVSGTVAAGSVPLLLNTSLTNPDQYFAEGTITFTSGLNAGVTRTVRTYANASGQILFFVPLPFAVSVGDAFTAYPGCDKQQSTCQNKFSNLVNFGGMPNIPIPESSI